MTSTLNPNGQFQLRVKVCEAFGLQRADRNGSADPYVSAKLRGKPLSNVKTSQQKNTLNPKWNQDLMLYPRGVTEVLVLKIYDHDSLKKNNFLGMVEIPLERFFQQGVKDTWLQLMRKKSGWKRYFGGKPSYFSAPGQIHVQLWFGNANQSIESTGFAPPNLAPIAPIVEQTQIQNQGMPQAAAAEITSISSTNDSTAAAMSDDSLNRANMQSITYTPSEAFPKINNDVIIDIPSNTPPVASSSTTTTTTSFTKVEFPSGFKEVIPEKFEWYKQGDRAIQNTNVVNTTMPN